MENTSCLDPVFRRSVKSVAVLGTAARKKNKAADNIEVRLRFYGGIVVDEDRFEHDSVDLMVRIKLPTSKDLCQTNFRSMCIQELAFGLSSSGIPIDICIYPSAIKKLFEVLDGAVSSNLPAHLNIYDLTVIEGFENVRSFGSQSSRPICCEEDYLHTIIRSPCGHRYHGDCFAKWWKLRHVSLLCQKETPEEMYDWEYIIGNSGSAPIMHDRKLGLQIDPREGRGCGVEWLDLPLDMWPVIGNFLDSRIDALRFRSVCSLWRSALPPFRPPPDPSVIPKTTTYRTYRMESLVNDHQKFLVKLEANPCSGKLRWLHPVTNHPLATSELDLFLLDYRLVELRKSYGLTEISIVTKYGRSRRTTAFYKMVFVGGDNKCGGIFRIDDYGKLEFARFGDENWIDVAGDDQETWYHDIILYKGRCYVVDGSGNISWVDLSNLQLIQFLPTPSPAQYKGELEWKIHHLVESCGDLYVVHQYFCKDNFYSDIQIDYKVYKVDHKELSHNWVNVRNLGDRVFVLSPDCSFSVSTTEFPGVKGNCIIYPHHEASRSLVFFLENEDGSKPSIADICAILQWAGQRPITRLT